MDLNIVATNIINNPTNYTVKNLVELFKRIQLEKIYDINDDVISIGDTVKIFKVTIDSGYASELFDVEAHLNAWITEVYFEEFIGEVIFDTERLMFMIKNKKTSIPLSNDMRFNFWNEASSEISNTEDIVKEFNLPSNEFEKIIDYIIKIK